MTGQEHYAEAERLLKMFFSENWADEEIANVYARAQAHATLALAAATGCVGNESERRAWLDVASA